MSKASEAVYEKLDKYLDTMAMIGKKPKNLYVNRKQFETLIKAAKVDRPENFNAHHRGYEIIVVRE